MTTCRRCKHEHGICETNKNHKHCNKGVCGCTEPEIDKE